MTVWKAGRSLPPLRLARIRRRCTTPRDTARRQWVASARPCSLLQRAADSGLELIEGRPEADGIVRTDALVLDLRGDVPPRIGSGQTDVGLAFLAGRLVLPSVRPVPGAPGSQAAPCVSHVRVPQL